MARFVKDGAFGYKAVPGGHSDPECTHVILTLKEYDKLLQEKARAEQEARSTKYSAEREIEEAKRAARYTAQKAAEEARQTVAGIESALAAEKADNVHQRALNANLLRIAKERANADRKLKPKKEHTGYVVVFSEEIDHQYKDGNRHVKRVLLWKTVIQSPYVVDFPEAQVRKQILEELLQEDEDGHRLIGRLGISGIYNKGYGSMIEDSRWCAEPDKYNLMIKPKFKANFRDGYWEVICLHTKPLDVVPKDMRVCAK